MERPDAVNALFKMEKLSGKQLEEIRKYILKIEAEIETGKG